MTGNNDKNQHHMDIVVIYSEDVDHYQPLH